MLAPTYDYYGQGELDQGSREENSEEDDDASSVVRPPPPPVLPENRIITSSGRIPEAPKLPAKVAAALGASSKRPNVVLKKVKKYRISIESSLTL